MQTLRNAKTLASFVLVWFALAIGAAVASPLVKPQAMELVCSGAGVMKLQPKTDDGSPSLAGHTLDCPLCVSVSAPPPVTRQIVEPFQPLSYALEGLASAHIAARTAAPLPARGPPAFS